MIHLITGYKGYEHIKSSDQGRFNAAFFGAGQNVLEFGNKLAASITSNNNVRILDGDVLMYGRHISVDADTYEDVTIETGQSGKNRIDLIVLTYEKNTSDGTEDAYIEVLKGEETSGTATQPSYINGNIIEGATKNQMPLYAVNINGVVLSSIKKLFTTIPTYKQLAEQYAVQFEKACNTYLGTLNILDSMEAINGNSDSNQLAGALALKELGKNLLNDLLVVDTFNIDMSKTTHEIDISKKGYTPIGIVGMNFTPNAGVYYFMLSFSNNNILQVHSNTPQAKSMGYANILYVKKTN